MCDFEFPELQTPTWSYSYPQSKRPMLRIDSAKGGFVMVDLDEVLNLSVEPLGEKGWIVSINFKNGEYIGRNVTPETVEELEAYFPGRSE